MGAGVASCFFAAQVTAAQPDMPTADVVAMYSSLMAFAIQARRKKHRPANNRSRGSFVLPSLFRCFNPIDARLGAVPRLEHSALFVSSFISQVHKDQLTFVDTVLQGCAAILANRPKASDTKAVKSLVALLVAPLEAYDVVSVLMLGSYPKVMAVLEHKTRKQVAVTIVRSVLKSGTVISRVDQARRAFPFLFAVVKSTKAYLR